MATKVTMPKLSDTMTEGVILKWVKKEGDSVKSGEVIVEIESDKADMELESYESGTLLKILIGEGQKAPIGGLIAVIGNKGEDVSDILSSSGSLGKAQQQMQKESESAERSAPVPPAKQMSELRFDSTPSKEKMEHGRVKASPLARRLAKDRGIDLSKLQGSGPLGRIIRRDIESVEVATLKSTSISKPSMLVIPAGESREVPLSPIRKTIAKRMTESKATAPHFYVTVELQMDPMIAFRNSLNAVSGLKISYTDLLIKASGLTLVKHPVVNGRFAGESIVEQSFAHVGVAVAMEDGLVTPVLRDAHAKGVGRINAELRDMVDRARNRKLKPEEYTGSTFTISNLGMYGVEDFIAIVNPPESAILAIGAIIEKPVVRDGAIVVGNTMKVTLSSDHRIIDGAVAASFLRDLKLLIENPAGLAL